MLYLKDTENALNSTFREVPKTGVIFVMSEAARWGYRADSADWTNFGQGQPETGALPGAPARIESIEILADDHEYSPVSGLWELREAVADHYNAMYRRGMGSQYSAENVSICGGGRTALTRVAASLGNINLGHMLPDYTAYEELLDLFRMFSPIPILLDPGRGYEFSLDELKSEILGRGLSAILLSNPCNPTGRLICGEMLRQWIDLGRSMDCTLILDEFYSHYIWNGPCEAATAARYVEDVERDPVVIVNGLTKSWRYPGWRLSWTLGPRAVIDRLASAGSFLDGGASRPLQRAAIGLLSEENTRAEMAAIQAAFRSKRDMLLERLIAMGIKVDVAPEGTFYVWGNVVALPEGLNTGMEFFRACLDNQIICVPGEFFDVNPGQRRAGRPSRFKDHIRFSFGPCESSLRAGLDRMEKMIRAAR
ncbi:MAG: pyridoxal phosphate-dependent aminotransferase [Bradymonadaceae bacterium]|nr:pyridoxal phosphate-dependent aminotransferase [Lujinxingiaceae bacterium]